MKPIVWLPILALLAAILCSILYARKQNPSESYFSTRFSREKKVMLERFRNIFSPNKKKGTGILIALAVLTVFVGGCFGFKLTASTPPEESSVSSVAESKPVSSTPVETDVKNTTESKTETQESPLAFLRNTLEARKRFQSDLTGSDYTVTEGFSAYLFDNTSIHSDRAKFYQELDAVQPYILDESPLSVYDNTSLYFLSRDFVFPLEVRPVWDNSESGEFPEVDLLFTLKSGWMEDTTGYGTYRLCIQQVGYYNNSQENSKLLFSGTFQQKHVIHMENWQFDLIDNLYLIIDVAIDSNIYRAYCYPFLWNPDDNTSMIRLDGTCGLLNDMQQFRESTNLSVSALEPITHQQVTEYLENSYPIQIYDETTANISPVDRLGFSVTEDGIHIFPRGKESYSIRVTKTADSVIQQYTIGQENRVMFDGILLSGEMLTLPYGFPYRISLFYGGTVYTMILEQNAQIDDIIFSLHAREGRSTNPER